jgi:copper chaperone CopZ
MKIQVLSFTGCPNHEATVRLVHEVARELGLRVTVEELEVTSAEDAARVRFLGSASVHVNGVDIEPSARSSTAYAFACRTYGGDRVPPRELLVAALKEAASGSAADGGRPAVATSGAPERGVPEGRPALLVGAAGVFAVLASACCLGPLVLTVFGISALGASTVFEPLRPLFLVVTALLLGGAFYLTHIRRAACAPGSACAAPQRRVARFSGALLWIAALVVTAVALFPTFIGPLLGGSEASKAAGHPSTTVVLHIDGRTGPACVGGIKAALQGVPGVSAASVDFATGQAVVEMDARTPSPDAALIRAVETAGYRARIEPAAADSQRRESGQMRVSRE